MSTLTLLHVVYSGCERAQVLVLSCLAVVFHLENYFEASQEGGARVYLQLQNSDVRHLDVEREFCIPARVEPVVFDWLRRWLRVPLEVLVVTSQDHLGNYNFRLLYNVDDLAFKIALREVCGKSKWKFKMAFAIRRPTPPPLMAKFPDIFLCHFFSFAI